MARTKRVVGAHETGSGRARNGLQAYSSRNRSRRKRNAQQAFWIGRSRIELACLGHPDPAGMKSSVPFVKEAFGDIETNQEGTGASPSRGPHHRHDPSPDGIGQAVPDGGKISPLGRDHHGVHESPQSLGLVRRCPSDAAAKEGRGANCFAFCFPLPKAGTYVVAIQGAYGSASNPTPSAS